MASSFSKAKAFMVLPTERVDVIATLLTTSHVRMLLTMAAVTITAWFMFSTLHMKCDFEDTAVLDSIHETQYFSNDPTERLSVSSIHWLECLNTTNHYKTKIPFTDDPPFVKLEWYEKLALRCVREDAATGRDTVHIAIILVGVLIALGGILQLIGLLQAKGTNTSHAIASMAFTGIHAVSHVAVIMALWYIQDYAFYASEDDDKREIPKAHYWMWFVVVTTGATSVIEFIGYLMLTYKRVQLFMGVKGSDTIDKPSVDNYQLITGDTLEKVVGQFKFRYVRTDHVLSQHSHERLTLSALMAAVCIVAMMAVRLHDDKPGVHTYEIVEGDSLENLWVGDETAMTGLGFHDRLTLFDRNCTLGTPFRMNVSMWHDVISTRHHIKHHMKSETDGMVTILGLFSALLVLEALASGALYWAQTKRLTTAFNSTTGEYGGKKSDPVMMDMFFSWIPLAFQLVNSCGSTLVILLLGYGITIGEDKIKDYFLAASVVGTVSFLMHFASTSVWFITKVNQPGPKPKEQQQ